MSHSSPTVSYQARPDAASEAELSALVACYRFILDCHAKKKGGPAAAPDDDAKESDGRIATEIIPE